MKPLSILADTTLPDPVPGGNTLEQNVIGILNAVIGVLSFVCVTVIIVGGITYMTSSGDASKVKKGKDTILYGVIGLIICVLAFAIVNFVISGILKPATTSTGIDETGYIHTLIQQGIAFLGK